MRRNVTPNSSRRKFWVFEVQNSGALHHLGPRADLIFEALCSVTLRLSSTYVHSCPGFVRFGNSGPTAREPATIGEGRLPGGNKASPWGNPQVRSPRARLFPTLRNFFSSCYRPRTFWSIRVRPRLIPCISQKVPGLSLRIGSGTFRPSKSHTRGPRRAIAGLRASAACHRTDTYINFSQFMEL